MFCYCTSQVEGQLIPVGSSAYRDPKTDFLPLKDLQLRSKSASVRIFGVRIRIESKYEPHFSQQKHLDKIPASSNQGRNLFCLFRWNSVFFFKRSEMQN